MIRNRWAGLVVTLVALALVAACTSGDDGPRSVSTADAYVAAIRWYVATAPGATPSDSTGSTDSTDRTGSTDSTDSTGSTGSTDSEPVVVYIAPADGNAIDAGAQAAVVKDLAEMKDTVTVIFADVRDDAIDLETDEQHVKDSAALLLVGKVDEGPPPVDVEIEVYRNLADDHTFQMRIARAGSDEFTVTAVTQVGQS